MGSAARVGLQQHGILVVNRGVLHGGLEELLRVLHEVLIQSSIKRNVDREGLPLPAASPPRLLPERRHSSREAEMQGDVQGAHINAQLQRVGGGDPPQVSAEQAALDRPAMLGRVPRPVGGDGLPVGRVQPVEHTPGVLQDKLRELSRLAERDGLQVVLDTLREEHAHLHDGRQPLPSRAVLLKPLIRPPTFSPLQLPTPPSLKLVIWPNVSFVQLCVTGISLHLLLLELLAVPLGRFLQRRVPKKEHLVSAGRSIIRHRRPLVHTGQILRVHHRVGNGGRRQEELGGDAPSSLQDPAEPSDHERDVASEHAPVGMRLV
mmetsp:Transcript_9774/g.34851  ORF Transcript_9774/g.34851 Transcript_9774/m.34851 type:complete len:319 (-) Transcript_9774:1941-2897(-)